MTEAGTAELLLADPNLNRVIAEEHSDHLWRMDASTLAELRAMDFDVALCTSLTKAWKDLLLAIRLGIPNRVGFEGKGLSPLATISIDSRNCSSMSAHFRTLIASLVGCPPNWHLKPRLYLMEADIAVANELWSILGLNDVRNTVALFAASRQRARTWPVDHLCRLADILGEMPSTRVVLCGTSKDRPMLERIADRCNSTPKISAGRLGVRELAAFIEKCSAVFTPDSGPRHLANAAGTPCVFIRNMAVHAGETSPYCGTETDLAPEGQYLSDQEQKAVLDQITPEQAATAISESLADKSATGLVHESINHP